MNSNQNTKLFIPENAFENVVCEMAAILSTGKRVNFVWWSVNTWHWGSVITVVSHEHWGISNHGQLHCLFNESYGQTHKAKQYRNHQSSASLALCEGNPQLLVDSPHKGSVIQCSLTLYRNVIELYYHISCIATTAIINRDYPLRKLESMASPMG